MMHPLFISVTLKPDSGYGTLTRTHCAAFYEKGVPFTLLLPRSAERVSVPYGKNVRYVLPDLPLSFSDARDMPKIFRLYARIRWEGPPPTLVHSLVDFPYAVLGGRIARQRGIPFFFSALGTYSVVPFRRWIDKFFFMPAYRDATGIFAISRFTAEAMKKASGRERPIGAVYLPVAPPPTMMTPVSSSRLSPRARIILSVGPLKERKGMDVLVNAMPHILASVPDARLVIAAAYGNEASCRALAEKAGVAEYVHFVRNPSTEELSALFSHAEVFAMTPRYIKDEFEGYGLVYVEAGWRGLPVVASRSGGVPEAVIHGQTGLLVAENDPVATAAALVRILTDGALAKRLGDGGYTRAAARTPAHYAEELLRLYEARSEPEGHSGIHEAGEDAREDGAKDAERRYKGQ